MTTHMLYRRMQVAGLLSALGLTCWVLAMTWEPSAIVLAYIYLFGAYAIRKIAIESRMYDVG